MQFDQRVEQLIQEADLPPPNRLPPVPAAYTQQAEASLRYTDIVAAALIGEAGGEPSGAMQRVMNAIMNRVKGGDPFRGAVNEVLKPYQFSFFNKYNKGEQKMQDIVKKAQQHPRWGEAKELALVGMRGRLDDLTAGSTHYHVTSGPSKVAPYWSNPKFGGKNPDALATNTFGRHTFFKNIK